MSAFTTIRNRPRVISVIGRVRKIRIGFTKIFKIAKTIDRIIAVSAFSISTPGRNHETIITARDVVINLARKGIAAPFELITQIVGTNNS
jgi:hypothetical protein